MHRAHRGVPGDDAGREPGGRGVARRHDARRRRAGSPLARRGPADRRRAADRGDDRQAAAVGSGRPLGLLRWPAPARRPDRGGRRSRARRRAGSRPPRVGRRPPRCCSLRSRGSIIGCGRPTVYSSSPRSITVLLGRRPSTPRTSLASPASVPPRVQAARSADCPGRSRLAASSMAAESAASSDLTADAGAAPRPRAAAARAASSKVVAGSPRRRCVSWIAAQEVDHDRLAGAIARRRAPWRPPRRRRLRDQHDHVGRRVGDEALERGQHHHAADALVEVAAADPDRLRDRPPRTRSSRQVTCCRPVPVAPTRPIAPRRTALAKPSGTPSRIAVPQSGPITSRPFGAGPGPSARPRPRRHVVAEEEDVQPALERLERLGGGIGAGRRDQRQVGAGQLVERLGDRGRDEVAAAPPPRRRPPAPSSRAAASLERRLGRGGVVRQRRATTRSLGPAAASDLVQRPASRRTPGWRGWPSPARRGSTPGSRSISAAMRISSTESR